MEVVDHALLTDEKAKEVFRQAKPCPICLDKDGLAIGTVMGAGPLAGRLILFCAKCNMEPCEQPVVQ